MLILFFGISWLINKILFGSSSQPTIEEEIQKQKNQEGQTRIYRNNTPTKPAKPTINDLGEDIDYEEIK